MTPREETLPGPSRHSAWEGITRADCRGTHSPPGYNKSGACDAPLRLPLPSEGRGSGDRKMPRPCVPSKVRVLYGHRGDERAGVWIATGSGPGVGNPMPRTKAENGRAVPVIAFFNQKGGTAKTTST